MSGIEIVLSVVVLTCVFIFAGLVLIYLSSKNKRSKEAVEEPKLDISDPVLSFIQEVKKQP